MLQHPQTTPWPPTRLTGSIFGITLDYWCIPIGKEGSDVGYHSQEIFSALFTIVNQLPMVKVGTQYLLNRGNQSGFSFCDVEMKIKIRELLFTYLCICIPFFKRIETIYDKIIDTVIQVLDRTHIAKGDVRSGNSFHPFSYMVDWLGFNFSYVNTIMASPHSELKDKKCVFPLMNCVYFV